jgi:hypothetical protein
LYRPQALCEQMALKHIQLSFKKVSTSPDLKGNKSRCLVQRSTVTCILLLSDATASFSTELYFDLRSLS